MFVLMGPQMMRNDLRQDLAHLSMLKTWPVSGATMVRGQVLAPTVVVTAVTWLLLLAAVAFGGWLRPGHADALPLSLHRVSLLIAAAVLAPPIILSQTIVQNGLAVVFPAWVTVGASRSRGIDAMGQRLLLMAGSLIALALAILPGAVVGAAAGAAVWALTGTVIIVLPALLTAIVIGAECWVATALLGRVLDRTDVTAIDAGE